MAGTTDAVLQWRGLSVVPTGYVRLVRPDDPAVDRYTGHAHVLSIGYFAVPGRLELVARHTGLQLDLTDPATRQREWSAGMNLYHLGHGWKTQLDYTRYEGTLVPVDHVLVVQMHLQF